MLLCDTTEHTKTHGLEALLASSLMEENISIETITGDIMVMAAGVEKSDEAFHKHFKYHCVFLGFFK